MERTEGLVKGRSSNLELLRIICMVLLIMHHLVVHGGSIGMEGMTANRIFSLIVLPAGKICFNCFVAISTWFLVRSTFKASRFVKVWLQVLFYNLVFLGATFAIGGEYAATLGWKNWLGAFFPMIGNSHGYAAAYLAFYLTIPFLRIVGDRIEKRQLTFLIVFLTVTQIMAGQLGFVTGYTQPFASEILLFVLCYFISLYLQKYPFQWQSNTAILLAIVLGIWLFTAFCRIFNGIYPANWFYMFFANIATGSEFSAFNILAGYALFLCFYKIKMPANKVINTLATTTFGILLMHDHNYFRPVVWHVIMKTETWYYVPFVRFVCYMIVATLIIFVAGMLIDFVRQFCIEKYILRTGMIKNLCGKLDGVFASLQNPKH